MKLTRHAFLIAVTLTFSSITFASQAGITGARKVVHAHRYVVAPGTRVVAGNPKLNEFYILGAHTRVNSTQVTSATHTGVKVRISKANIAQEQKAHHYKLAIKNAFHHPHVKTHANHLAVKSFKHKKTKQQLALHHKPHVKAQKPWQVASKKKNKTLALRRQHKHTMHG